MSDDSKFRGPHIGPGSKVAVQVGDELVEGTIHSYRYTSARPEILKHPTGWRKWLRVITPTRWRKPLPVVQPYQPAQTEIITVDEKERRARRLAEDIEQTIHRLTQQR